MEEALEKGNSSKLSLSEMKNQLQKAMGQNAGAREVKPLRECPRFDSFFIKDNLNGIPEVVSYFRGKISHTKFRKSLLVWY